MAAAVVELADLARRRLAVLEQRPGRRVERRRPSTCARGLSVLSARNSSDDREREELAERVPAQVVLLHELLHVLGRRAAGAGLEQPAAVHQRHDREHLRARAELEDREQVGQVVAQHVAGDRDRVLAARGALEREAGRLGDRQDLDLQPVGVVRRRRYARDLLEHLARRARASRRARTRRARRSRGRARPRAAPSRAIGASLVWHARQMSPASTSCSSSVVARAVDDAHACRPPRSRTSCRGCRTPRPSAPSGRRSASCPSSPGRTRRARGRSRSSPRTAPRSCESGITALVSCCSPSAFHIWPDVRIIAGIDASMITSLGTCRLVIPRSESTIASVRRRLVGRLDRGLDRLALVAGQRPRARVRIAGQAVVRARRRRWRARRRARRTRRRSTPARRGRR